MSSGDPLVDQEAQRLEALNKMLDSLASKDSLVLEAEIPIARGDDPLVDAEEEALKKREALLDSLAGKGKILAAQQTPDARTVEEALQEMNNYVDTTDLEAERRKRLQASEVDRRVEAEDTNTNANGNGFIPDLSAVKNWFKKDDGEKNQQLEAISNDVKLQAAEPTPPDVSGLMQWFKKDGSDKTRQLSSTEADKADWRRRSQTLEADAQEGPGHRLEATDADRKSFGFKFRKLGASGLNEHSNAADIPQMFGGAFILVAVVALVAVARRRRKPATPEPVVMDDAGDCDYQLFM